MKQGGTYLLLFLLLFLTNYPYTLNSNPTPQSCIQVQMKQGGMYLARNLSFRGATLQVVPPHPLRALRIVLL